MGALGLLTICSDSVAFVAVNLGIGVGFDSCGRLFTL